MSIAKTSAIPSPLQPLHDGRARARLLNAYRLAVIIPVVAGVGYFTSRELDSLAAPEPWMWALVIAFVEMFPVRVWQRMTLTLGDPLLLALSMIQPPSVVTVLAFVALCDPRELRGEVGFTRALFNRAQLTVSWIAASAVFHSVADVDGSWPLLLGGGLLSMGVSYALNIGLVAISGTLEHGVAPQQVVRGLFLDAPGDAVAGFTALGVLGALAARLYVEIESEEAVLVAVALALVLLARGTFVQVRALERESALIRGREQAFRRLSERLAEERHDERLRIAAELHDDVVPLLQGVNMLANSARLTVDSADRDDLRQTLATICSATGDGMQVLRRVIGGLRESPLGTDGLQGALEQLVDSLRADGGPSVELALDVADVPGDRQLPLYQLAREALMNAVRHAKAEHVRVSVQQRRNQLRLSVSDDGIGFDPDRVPPNHFGVALMRERSASLGGQLTIESSSRGTTVQIDCPV